MDTVYNDENGIRTKKAVRGKNRLDFLDDTNKIIYGA